MKLLRWRLMVRCRRLSDWCESARVVCACARFSCFALSFCEISFNLRASPLQSQLSACRYLLIFALQMSKANCRFKITFSPLLELRSNVTWNDIRFIHRCPQWIFATDKSALDTEMERGLEDERVEWALWTWGFDFLLLDAGYFKTVVQKSYFEAWWV